MQTAGPPPAYAALAEVAAYDPAVFEEPSRLRAALVDLVDDETGIAHVLTSVRLGVPTRVADGLVNAATSLLVDTGGLRSDLAAQLVESWDRALQVSRGDDAGFGSAFRDIAVAAPPAVVTPTGATACHVWPDGAVTVAVMDLAGVVVTTVDNPTSVTARADWRIVTPVQAPVSRAVALGAGPHGGPVLCWTDRTGVWKRALRRDERTGVVELGEVVAVDTPSSGEPRYPMTAAAADGTDPDVFWTVDRRGLFVSVHDALDQVHTSSPESPCQDTERLTAIDCVAVGSATRWLVALTDRGRMLLARWDLAARDHDGWQPIAMPPFGGATVAAVAVGSGTLLAGGSRGGFAQFDIAAGYAGSGWWRDIEVPGAVEGVQALSTGTNGHGAWCAAASPTEVRLLRLVATTEGMVCPNVVTLTS